MHIRFAILPDGAFVCGDESNGITSYSYPTSPNARTAARLAGHPGKLLRFAAKRLRDESGGLPRAWIVAYDKANWAKLRANHMQEA